MKILCSKIAGSVLFYLSLLPFLFNTGQASTKVVVSIIPQKYFVEKIAGDLVEVTVLVKKGHNPATYNITPKQMVSLSKADLYFRIGVGFENALLRKITSVISKNKIIDTRKNIKLRRMLSKRKHEHDSYSGGYDPHIWLDPNLVKIQAKTICDALTVVIPDKKDLLEKNLELFVSEMDKLNLHLMSDLKNLSNRKFMVFHPSWGYFADAFSLTQIPIEIEGKSPTAAQIVRITDLSKKEDIKVIFVQPQFSRKAADLIAKNIGCKVIIIDPLAENYIDNLVNVAELLKEAMSN